MSKEFIFTLAKTRGGQIGSEYAESLISKSILVGVIGGRYTRCDKGEK